MNIDGFKMICQASCDDLREWLAKELTAYYGAGSVIANEDYIFCIGNCGTGLCAHLDTVHKEQPETFIYNAQDNTMSSPQGIGGDDRCGVYAILRILYELKEKNVKPFLFFSTDEETGGSTTKKAAKEVKSRAFGINYLIELDRQGSKDSVYYKCDNKEFKKWIDSFGFVEANGSFTDICTLCKEWDLAGVNFSVGYTKNHTLAEIVNFNDLEATIQKTIRIIENSKPDEMFLFCEKKETTTRYYGNTSFYRVGDTIETTIDTIGFVVGKERSFVEEYVEIDAYSIFKIIEVNLDEVCVNYNGKNVWINREDVRFSTFTK